MSADEVKVFTRLLLARESPSNKCLGPDGSWLVPAGPGDRADVRLGEDEHFFVSLPSRQTNIFGWVGAVPGMTIDDLMSADKLAWGNDRVELPSRDIYLSYLSAVAKQEPGTPMACHWLESRLPGRHRRVLRVHKVIFQQRKA